MAGITSFRQYIAQRRATSSPNGDFVEDAKADKRLPDATSWQELESYLRGRGAIRDAMNAAKAVWRQFEAQRDRA